MTFNKPDPVQEQLYRKTALITASQWFKMGDHPAVVLKSARSRYADEGIPWINTLEGGHVVTPGDWIATGVKGEHWPIKPDVFAKSYELASLPTLSPTQEVDKMPRTDDREPFSDDGMYEGYLESDIDWCRRNSEAVSWLIDNHVAIRSSLEILNNPPPPPATAQVPSDAEAMREACAKVADDEAEGSRYMHNLAAKDHDRDGCLVHGEGWRTGKAIAAAIRALPTPRKDGEVVQADAKERDVLVAAGLSEYAAHCALRTGDGGMFCHAYFYSDEQWRFQTGGNDLVDMKGKSIRCILTRPLYTHPPKADDSALREALKLAANRLARCALDHEVSSEKFCEVSEWGEEARAALAQSSEGE